MEEGEGEKREGHVSKYSDQNLSMRNRSIHARRDGTNLVRNRAGDSLHVSVDHLLDERVKVDLPSPAKGLLSLGGRPKQQINFTRSEVLSQRKTAKPGAGR